MNESETEQDQSTERWRVHARWQLGKITNGEYADFLDGDPYSPATEILVGRLRENPEGRQRDPGPA